MEARRDAAVAREAKRFDGLNEARFDGLMEARADAAFDFDFVLEPAAAWVGALSPNMVELFLGGMFRPVSLYQTHPFVPVHEKKNDAS